MPYNDKMPPQHVKTLRGGLRMTQPQFAALLGVSRDLVAKWECGVYAVPDARIPALLNLTAKAKVMLDNIDIRNKLILSMMDKIIDNVQFECMKATSEPINRSDASKLLKWGLIEHRSTMQPSDYADPKAALAAVNLNGPATAPRRHGDIDLPV